MTNLRRFKCTICSEKFHSKYLANEHLWRAHFNKLYDIELAEVEENESD